MIFEIPWRNIAVIATTYLLLVSEGINYCLIGPFFPNEAELNKAISEVSVGVIDAMFDVCIIMGCLSLFFSSASHSRAYIIMGAVLAAVANICFGLLTYVPGGWMFAVSSAACRAVMGLGSSMVWGHGISWLITLAPAKYSGTILAMTNGSAGVGMVVGPILASSAYSLGGYVLPFLLSGVIELLISAIVFAIPPENQDFVDLKKPPCTAATNVKTSLPPDRDCGAVTEILNENMTLLDNTGTDNEKKDNILWFLVRIPAFWTVSTSLCVGSLTYNMLNVVLSPFLLDTFGVDGDTAGYFLFGQAIGYFTGNFLVGYIMDSGFGAHAFFWFNVATSLLAFAFFLPFLLTPLEHKVYIALLLALNGLFLAFTTSPAFVVLRETALRKGFRQSIKELQLHLSVWSNISVAAGRILGSSLFGGLIYQICGYYIAFFWTGVFLTTTNALCGLHFILAGNYSRMAFT